MLTKRKPLAATQAHHQRLTYLTAVMSDLRLSENARILYWWLDYHARIDGRCWPKQTRLAAFIGISARHLRRCMEELCGFGHVSKERGARVNTIHLAWFSTDRTPMSYQTESERTFPASDRTPMSDHESVSLYETSHNETSACDRCAGAGYLLVAARHGRRSGIDTGVRLCGCVEGLTYADAVALARRLA